MRFTIRELVLVTIIVAMGVAWWLDYVEDHWRWKAGKMEDALNSAGWIVTHHGPWEIEIRETKTGRGFASKRSRN